MTKHVYPNKENTTIAILGLGYVGLPLAVEFSKKFKVIGFDKNEELISELLQFNDQNKQITNSTLKRLITNEKGKEKNTGLFLSTKSAHLESANVYIVTVPTPVNSYKKPDLSNLFGATKLIGRYLKKNDVVVYESTTFPGCTEDECVPILEKISNLKYNRDFFVGYSPERVSPGKDAIPLTDIVKVTSGSNNEVADYIDSLYKSIIQAGTYRATSIKVAEASKAIENAQRDLNISFINELSIIFERIGIDTMDVLKTASTKWNFHPYKPGLVGGHCISVDPYYLAHKAEKLGYQPDVILSGRRVNDYMGKFVASKLVKLMVRKGISIKNAQVLILGITFKENFNDTRNSKVADTFKELKEFGCKVEVYDPIANKKDCYNMHNIELIDKLNSSYDGIILAVGHDEFKSLNLNSLKKENSVIYDLKSFFDRDLVDARL